MLSSILYCGVSPESRYTLTRLVHSELSLYLSLHFLISVLIFAFCVLLFHDCCKSICRHAFFCNLTHPIVSLATSNGTFLIPFQRSCGVISSCVASKSVNLLVTSAANCAAFSSLSAWRFRGGMLCYLCVLASLTFSIATNN